jgi:hypothetical protein
MIRTTVIAATLFGLLAFARPAAAHCDTTRGPVVTAARAALEAGDANLLFHWVRPEDEAVVRSAFQHTLEVRALSPEAKALADRYFFETLVRIHRAGEGAPYTGLTDGEPEPIISATDRAIESGSTHDLEQELVAAVKAGLAERFSATRAAKDFRPGDVAGGRVYVAAYVPLTHWVEGVFTAAKGTAEHHAGAVHAEATGAAHHEPSTHGGAGAAVKLHGPRARELLPWGLVGLLAIAVLVEGAFLVRRRRSASA